MPPRDLQLAVLRDSRVEGWPSMDRVADELLAHLPEVPHIQATDLEAPFSRFATRLPILGSRKVAFNCDRLIYRHVVVPRHVRKHARCDFLHVADHTYAHAALAFPPGKVGVYCHDLDAFRSLLEPEKEPRPAWFRWLARRTLRGMQSAAVVFYSTLPVRDQILKHRLVEPDRLVHAPYGVSDEFTPEAREIIEVPGLPTGPYLLHVGNHLPRKRIDLLLDIFAAVRKSYPELRLVQVGPAFSAERQQQIAALGMGDRILQLSGLSAAQIAACYRSAAVVLLPSDAEGFGFPVIEALASGAIIVASDIPVLREVGGDAAIYNAVGDITGWVATIWQVLADPRSVIVPSRERRLAHVARFRWSAHARTIADAYRRLYENENRH